MKFVVLLGRLLFTYIFLSSVPHHFSDKTIHYAAASGVPAANIAVPLAGIISLIGALSILLGFKARIGAWLIVLFLLPVTFAMHHFWTITDPMMRQMQEIMFNKNISILGASLMITWFGSGPLSIDAWWAARKRSTH